VTVFVTKPEAFITIQQAVRTFERAKGARLNPRKSKELATGAWTETPTALGIDLYQQVSIVGVDFGPTIATPNKTTGRGSHEQYGFRRNRRMLDIIAWYNGCTTCSIVSLQRYSTLRIFSPASRTCAPNDDHMVLVPLAGGDLPSSHDNPPAIETIRRMGPPTRRGKMQDPVVSTSFDIKGIVHKECPNRPNCEFRVLLRCFAAIA
jgi:hypothetical protein